MIPESPFCMLWTSRRSWLCSAEGLVLAKLQELPACLTMAFPQGLQDPATLARGLKQAHFSPQQPCPTPPPPGFLALTWPSVACRIRDCRMCMFAWISLSLIAFANCTREDVVKQASAQAVWRLETLGMSFGWLHYISSSLLNYLRCIHLYCTYSLRRPENKLFPLTPVCAANTCCDSDLITHKNFIEPDGCNFYCFCCYSNWVVLKTSTVD